VFALRAGDTDRDFEAAGGVLRARLHTAPVEPHDAHGRPGRQHVAELGPRERRAASSVVRYESPRRATATSAEPA
jgi:hypothetical protein